MRYLSQKQHERVIYWCPALLAGLTAWLAYIYAGQTPVLRAAALSLVIVGISLSLRRLNGWLAYLGGLTLAFSPAYWSQTGGPPSINTWLVVGFIIAGGIFAFLALQVRQELFLSFAIGISIFVGLYLIFGITQRSLRITTILSAWLIYMLITALRQTNPRPEEPPATPLSRPHTYGVLLMMILGILNDPLLTLFAPAIILGLWLSSAKLPRWYWVIMAGITVWGTIGISNAYISTDWLVRSSAQMTLSDQNVPYIVLDGWREPLRWLYMTNLIASQFTFVGILLGIVGIARLSRWYPTLGITLTVAYGSYGVFGLLYFGKDAEILLLPMLMIQTIWMTYAVYTALQWASRLSHSVNSYVQQST